jgi:hypothetical protein
LKSKNAKDAVLVVIALAVLSACDSEPDPQAARRFFEKANVSLTPVFGILKNGSDHVATVHGFVDNLSICEELVTTLNKPEATKSFSCAKLNDGAFAKRAGHL